MSSILIIGDFSEQRHLEKAKQIIQFYRQEKILISGKSMNEIGKMNKENVKNVLINSPEYIEGCFFSELVFVLDNNIRYSKVNTKQRVIKWGETNSLSFVCSEEELNTLINTQNCYTDYIMVGETNYSYFLPETRMISIRETDTDFTVLQKLNLEIKESQTKRLNFIFVFDTLENFLASEQAMMLLQYKEKFQRKISAILLIEKIERNIQGNIEEITGVDVVLELKFYLENLKVYLGKKVPFIFIQHKKDKKKFEINYGHRIQKIDFLGLIPNDLKYADLIEYLDGYSDKTYKQKLYLSHLKSKINDLSHLPKVTVIIPHYNTPLDILERAIDSAIDSTYRNLEVVIIDDGSEYSLEGEITERFGERVRYLRKANEGLGLTRNYGVKNSDGEYIFFLDSDDTITGEGILYMVAQSLVFDAKVVVGKRLIIDENSQYINESLRELYGQSYMNYYKKNMDEEDTNKLYFYDQMANNKLCHRTIFSDDEIWFEKGLYEDAMFTTKIYTKLDKVSFLNVDIHNWYKYGENTTISSTKTYNNFEERVSIMESVWVELPENVRKQKLAFNVSNELDMYYQNYSAFDTKEQENFLKRLSSYIKSREAYIDFSKIRPFVKTLIYYFKNNELDKAGMVLEQYSILKMKYPPNRNNFFCHTYYHILVSILYALDSNDKNNLYLNRDYIKFSPEFLMDLKGSGLFEDVVTYTNGNVVSSLVRDLKKDYAKANVLIPHHLYSQYANICQKINKENTNFLFSDSLPIWYFLEREFSNFIKLEDAYDSFEREIKLSTFHGMWGEVLKYIPQDYPQINFTSEKIAKIIVSKPIKNLDNIYANKVEVKDTKELINQHREKFVEILNALFDVPSIQTNSNRVILLTQPLYKVGYCTEEEQIILYKIMLKKYEECQVYIKPHPADDINYKEKFPDAIIFSKSVPVEVYNYANINFDTALTFGSSAAETIDIAENIVVIFKLKKFSKKDVRKKIVEILKSHKFNINEKFDYKEKVKQKETSKKIKVVLNNVLPVYLKQKVRTIYRRITYK